MKKVAKHSLKNLFLFFICIQNFNISLFSAAPVLDCQEYFPTLDGQALTVIDLHNLKNDPHTLLTTWKDKAEVLRKKNDPQNTKVLKDLFARIARLEHLITFAHPYCFWWQVIPTIGIRLEEPFWPIHYPYIPHAFSLWQLAPHLGNEIHVFLIDTGIAAFNLDTKEFYKKHQDLQMLADFSKEKYNLVAHTKDMLDPFEQLIEMIVEYTNDTKENEHRIRKNLPQWIHNYVSNQKETDIIAYLYKYGKPSLIEMSQDKKKLSEEGKRALREILHGEQGFKPKHSIKKHPYTVTDLNAPNHQKNIILEFVPTAPILQDSLSRMSDSLKEDTYFSASYESGHGSHSAGIIGGLLHSYTESIDFLTPSKIKTLLHKDSGMCGFAPKCHLMMIKSLRSDGQVSDRTTITRGVKHAYKLGAQILNLSLKVDDQLDTTDPDVMELQSFLAKIPYVAASSGNATKKVLGVYQAGIESYPAKFPSIPFDVGAFSFYKDKKGLYHCPITDLSQYQENIGPKFVMPGHNILSCGLIPNQKEDSMYVFMQGTSAAAPMISGALALILGEFKGVFGRQERETILKVCYTSGIRMEASEEWKKRTLLGTLDVRTVLFTLHVLKRVKYNQMLKKKFPLNKYRDHYIKAISMILISIVDVFRKEQKIQSSFKFNFIGFFNETLPKRSKTMMNHSIFHSLEDALDMVVDTLQEALVCEKSTFPKLYNLIDCKKQLAHLFTHKTCDVFAEYSNETKARLALAL